MFELEMKASEASGDQQLNKKNILQSINKQFCCQFFVLFLIKNFANYQRKCGIWKNK